MRSIRDPTHFSVQRQPYQYEHQMCDPKFRMHKQIENEPNCNIYPFGKRKHVLQFIQNTQYCRTFFYQKINMIPKFSTIVNPFHLGH
jgi:hypothetical protein